MFKRKKQKIKDLKNLNKLFKKLVSKTVRPLRGCEAAASSLSVTQYRLRSRRCRCVITAKRKAGAVVEKACSYNFENKF